MSPPVDRRRSEIAPPGASRERARPLLFFRVSRREAKENPEVLPLFAKLEEDPRGRSRRRTRPRESELPWRRRRPRIARSRGSRGLPRRFPRRRRNERSASRDGREIAAVLRGAARRTGRAAARSPPARLPAGRDRPRERRRGRPRRSAARLSARRRAARARRESALSPRPPESRIVAAIAERVRGAIVHPSAAARR